jgi:hypothetical protein
MTPIPAAVATIPATPAPVLVFDTWSSRPTTRPASCSWQCTTLAVPAASAAPGSGGAEVVNIFRLPLPSRSRVILGGGDYPKPPGQRTGAEHRRFSSMRIAV